MNRIGFPVLCCLFQFFMANIAIAAESPTVEQQQAIAKTARFYLESNGSYVSGDLITKSQLDELQQYLRRSLGNSQATHRGMLNRALKDDAPLSRLFFSKNGSQTMKSAAEKLGGYGQLEALLHDTQARQAFQLAIANGTEADLISTMENAPKIPSEKSSGKPQKHSRRQLKSIYTLEDLLDAAFPQNSEKYETQN